ncbi:hypothetical protein [Sandaracinus amylolyticus]|uniref:hypothetical protein n=1 Tax=Sandaracinus amylolyticus TaxID=927083 RepID=UPI001F34E29D|nr:hypothetical protein [Sandaracinus amylolyticus]
MIALVAWTGLVASIAFVIGRKRERARCEHVRRLLVGQRNGAQDEGAHWEAVATWWIRHAMELRREVHALRGYR